jgi:hypothetical protein
VRTLEGRTARRAVAALGALGFVLALSGCKQAPGTIIVVAGNGTTATASGDGGQAKAAAIGQPTSVAVDGAGVEYIASWLTTPGEAQIRAVATDGTISTLLTSSVQISGLVAATDGTLYYVEGLNTIHERATDGTVTTVAGPYAPTSSGPQGVWGIALAPGGRLLAALTNQDLVVSIDLTTHASTVVAGGGPSSSLGDGGPATSANLSHPVGVAADALGDIFIGDEGHGRLREVTPDGTISTIAGDGSSTAPTPGPALASSIGSGQGLVVDSTGNVFRVDETHKEVLRISPAGALSVVAGPGSTYTSVGGTQVTGNPFTNPSVPAFDKGGDLLVPDYGLGVVYSIAPPFN